LTQATHFYNLEVMDIEPSELEPKSAFEQNLFSSLDAFDQLQATLIDWRKSNGISQTAVAELLGISQPMVSKIENSQAEIQLLTLVSYAAALGVSITFNIEN